MEADGGRSGGLAEEGDVVGVAAEDGDVVPDPLQRHQLVSMVLELFSSSLIFCRFKLESLSP